MAAHGPLIMQIIMEGRDRIRLIVWLTQKIRIPAVFLLVNNEREEGRTLLVHRPPLVL